MNRDLVGDARQLRRKALNAADEEGGVRKVCPFRAPRTGREGIGARVDGDREGIRLGSGSVEDIAAVTRADVDEDVAEGSG